MRNQEQAAKELASLVDPKAAALSIVSQLDKQQTNSQIKKTNGPAETGSLLRHKEILNSKVSVFNYFISARKLELRIQNKKSFQVNQKIKYQTKTAQNASQQMQMSNHGGFSYCDFDSSDSSFGSHEDLALRDANSVLTSEDNLPIVSRSIAKPVVQSITAPFEPTFGPENAVSSQFWFIFFDNFPHEFFTINTQLVKFSLTTKFVVKTEPESDRVQS